MTADDFVLSLAFAALWTVGLMWWCAAYTFKDVAVFWILGEIVGFGWVLAMRRLGYFAKA